jgi:hypothetical protein
VLENGEVWKAGFYYRLKLKVFDGDGENKGMSHSFLICNRLRYEDVEPDSRSSGTAESKARGVREGEEDGICMESPDRTRRAACRDPYTN